MKTLLLHPDRECDWRWLTKAATKREAAQSNRRMVELDSFDPTSALPWNWEALVHDLGLEPLFDLMAKDDADIYEMTRRELLNGGQNDLATIRYRQDMLRDGLANPQMVRTLHNIAVAAVRDQDRHFLGSLLRAYPDQVLRWAIETMEAMLAPILKLRGVADEMAERLEAPGWRRFIELVRTELDDEYLLKIRRQLDQLRFRNGVLMSVGLDEGLQPNGFRLHQAPLVEETVLHRLLRRWLPSLFPKRRIEFGFSVAARDESGVRALRDFANNAIAIAAQALGDAALHLKEFFEMLRAETAFLVGAIRLHEALSSAGLVTAMPDIAEAGASLGFRGLYEPGLALRIGGRVVSNDLEADGMSLIVLTGANQGGKSTLLRAIGVAQATAMAGMFVPANSLSTGTTPSILTHYKREEDSGMASGKFDEELSRMSAIADRFEPGALLLLNESFASTSEREASEIADDAIEQFRQAGGRVIYVTHLFEYANRAASRHDEAVLFLRAERDEVGNRSFRLVQGAPLETSYGEDLYRRIFGRTSTSGHDARA